MTEECPICLEDVIWLDLIHNPYKISSKPHRACIVCINKIKKNSINDTVLCPLCRKDIISDKPDSSEEGFSLYISLGFGGRTISVRADPNNTILDIKNKVNKLVGIPPWGVRWVCIMGKMLSDKDMLKNFNIEHGSTLTFGILI